MAKTLERKLSINMTPLTPLAPHERLGWLDGAKAIRCSINLNGFEAGRLYRVQTRTQKIRSLTIRLCEGKREKVLVTGDEFSVVVLDNLRRRNLFTDHEPPSRRGFHAIYSTEVLVDHFLIPHVPDAAEVQADDYQRLIARLSSF
jgi:hypothetical protein